MFYIRIIVILSFLILKFSIKYTESINNCIGGTMVQTSLEDRDRIFNDLLKLKEVKNEKQEVKCETHPKRNSPLKCLNSHLQKYVNSHSKNKPQWISRWQCNGIADTENSTLKPFKENTIRIYDCILGNNKISSEDNFKTENKERAESIKNQLISNNVNTTKDSLNLKMYCEFDSNYGCPTENISLTNKLKDYRKNNYLTEGDRSSTIYRNRSCSLIDLTVQKIYPSENPTNSADMRKKNSKAFNGCVMTNIQTNKTNVDIEDESICNTLTDINKPLIHESKPKNETKNILENIYGSRNLTDIQMQINRNLIDNIILLINKKIIT